MDELFRDLKAVSIADACTGESDLQRPLLYTVDLVAGYKNLPRLLLLQ